MGGHGAPDPVSEMRMRGRGGGLLHASAVGLPSRALSPSCEGEPGRGGKGLECPTAKEVGARNAVLREATGPGPHEPERSVPLASRTRPTGRASGSPTLLRSTLSGPEMGPKTRERGEKIDNRELMERIERDREELMQVLERGDAGADRADPGGWTVKDHLFHIAVWEDVALARVEGGTAEETIRAVVREVPQDELEASSPRGSWAGPSTRSDLSCGCWTRSRATPTSTWR